MFRLVRVLPVCFLLFVPATVKAQESGPADVESLRKKIEAQEAQIKLLQESLQRQSEILQQQQSILESLKQKLDPAKPSATLAAQITPPRNEEQRSDQNRRPGQRRQGQPGEPVEAGAGRIRFTGLIQGWFASGDRAFRDTFRLRRAQLRFTGDINENIRWVVMLDAAKALSVNNSLTDINGSQAVSDSRVDQASRILQDAYIRLDYTNNKARVEMGQFKVPLSMEMNQQASSLDTVERALFISDPRGIGVARDLGVMVRGRVLPQLDYQFGAFNGSGESQNEVDRNQRKAFIGRVVFRPFTGLQLGASGAWAGDGSRLDSPRRDRLGGEISFNRDKFRAKSEVMALVDSDVHRLGYYAHIGYRIVPRFEPIFRFDSFDPNTGIENAPQGATERDYIAGFNYFLAENRLKLQFNYLRKTFDNNLLPSRHLVLVNLQTSW